MLTINTKAIVGGMRGLGLVRQVGQVRLVRLVRLVGGVKM